MQKYERTLLALLAATVDHFGLRQTCKDVTICNDKALAEEVLADTLADSIHLIQNESIGHKVLRIFSRYKRIWHYREVSIESVPMIVNSFAFSSHMKKRN